MKRLMSAGLVMLALAIGACSKHDTTDNATGNAADNGAVVSDEGGLGNETGNAAELEPDNASNAAL